MLARALTPQENRDVVSPAKPIRGMGDFTIRVFLRMNPPEHSGSKMEKDPNRFIEEVYKVLAIMEVSLVEKAELATIEECSTNLV